MSTVPLSVLQYAGRGQGQSGSEVIEMVEDFVGHLRRNITALRGKQLLCRTGDFSHMFRIFFL